jgi:hypothetical protein
LRWQEHYTKVDRSFALWSRSLSPVACRQVVAGHRRMKAVVPSLSWSAYTVDSDHDVFQGCVPLRYPAGQSSKRTSSPPRSSQPSSTTTKSVQCMDYPALSHLVACIEASRHQRGAFWRTVGGDHCYGLSYDAAGPTGQLASPSLAKMSIDISGAVSSANNHNCARAYDANYDAL